MSTDCTASYGRGFNFEGWETALDPQNLSLLSILNFRRKKHDFTFDKRSEHFSISKFVSWIAKNATDKRWKEVASVLNDGVLANQAQGEGVRVFWNTVEMEVATIKLKKAEAQFAVDQSLTGNKANEILNEMKLDFILNGKRSSEWAVDNFSVASGSTKKIKYTENVDSCEDDELDYSNHEIGPNIELERQISFQKHIKKYPGEDSSSDVWLLPSRKSINEVIRGPESLHKSHPSCLGIIRIGPKIRKPEWIDQDDWNYLNSSVEYPHCNLSSETENLFTTLLDTNSLNEYEECLYTVTFDRKNNKEMTFVTDVLLWFAKNVFNTTSAFHSINKNEALLGSLMIHPILQYLTNTTDHVIYVPGEIHLKASANQRFLRRNLKPEDDKPKGMKVDGSFQSPDDKGLEIGMVELSGGYLTSDLPRYLKDHVKGYWGSRDLLNDIVKKFNHGDYKILRRLRTWFFHIHGLEVQIWGMDLPVSKAYRMFLIGVFRLPINWDEHHELVYALKILWNLGRGLDDTLMILKELKKSHRRNTALRSQSLALKSYLGDAKSSPQKPTGKKSRTISPLMYYDYDDSDYDGPPSPSPPGCSKECHDFTF